MIDILDYDLFYLLFLLFIFLIVSEIAIQIISKLLYFSIKLIKDLNFKVFKNKYKI